MPAAPQGDDDLADLLAAWDRRVEADAEVRRLLKEARARGVTVRRLEALLGISRMTVLRWGGSEDQPAS